MLGVFHPHCRPSSDFPEVIQMSPGHGAFRVETTGQRRLPLEDRESNILFCALVKFLNALIHFYCPHRKPWMGPLP